MKGLLAHQGSLAEARHLQPDLVNARDQHRQVVSDDLAQHFVHLTNVRLGTERVTKLPLDHAEGGLDVDRWW